MFEKLVTRSGPKFTLTMLPGAGLLAAASVLALGLVFIATTPQPAWAAANTSAPCTAQNTDSTQCGDDSDVGGSNKSTAVGDGAEAGTGGGNENTALGRDAAAGKDSDTTKNLAVGENAHAEGGQATAVGQGAEAGSSTSGDENTALGNDADAGTGGGQNNVAVGADAEAGNTTNSRDNVAVGESASAEGGDAVAVGQAAKARNDGTAIGNKAEAGTGGGQNNVALGADAEAGTKTATDNATALGHEARAEGNRDTAVGAFASVLADDGSAFGTGATVEAGAEFGTALGVQARVVDGHDNSTAIGAFARTTDDHQLMFGTSGETYAMPGITSLLSKSRQSGPLEVVTTDADGNLASDGGSIFKSIEENTEGIAMAMALENPDLKGSENFGIAINGGFFEGSYAIAGAVMATLTDDLFSQLGAGSGGRLALAGGGAYGVEHNNFGGRVGFQLTW